MRNPPPSPSSFPFPESPPPGLVTIPVIDDIDAQIYLMSGYKPAGVRAIRIDMLERLADMLRAEDSRAGFEAKADMLSITGMTLEQFANLMEGLGYKAEKGEREKQREIKAEDPAAAADAEAPAVAPESDVPPADAEAAEAPETEVFYTFTWGGNRANPRQRQGQGQGQGQKAGQGQAQGRERPQGQRGKPKGKPRQKPEGGQKPRSFEARPPRKEKPIDPDNPFAQALMGLRDKQS